MTSLANFSNNEVLALSLFLSKSTVKLQQFPLIKKTMYNHDLKKITTVQKKKES
jgi:hypothetical protein